MHVDIAQDCKINSLSGLRSSSIRTGSRLDNDLCVKILPRSDV